jgi:hypothetical protein
MQTNIPSVGNNVKLNPLGLAVDSIAYKNGFINLKGVEPSLGLPSGFTLTQPNSVYYFPIFGISNTYGDSRKFTGRDTLVFVNKNVGYNNINPTFNIDISGNFRSLSAYIPNLSATYIVPASGSDTLYVNATNVLFNSDLYLNNKTYINSLYANSVFTNSLTAENRIENNTIINIFQLTGAYVDHDVVIAGNLTATDVFAASSIEALYLDADLALFSSLTSEFVTVTDTLSVGGDIYANRIYGQVDLDPFSQLYYNNSNQLSIGSNQTYEFAVRPSDSYSTDNINVPRTRNGDWDSNYGTISPDNSLKPYFKNLQAVFDYVYYNGLVGQNLYIYIDEDLIAGEDKPNFFTTDRSGEYAGCTITGNLTAKYYSTEWLGANYPSLTAAGMLGGDFVWAKDTSVDINGVFSYLNLPPLEFNVVHVYGRFEIGSMINSNKTAFYSTWRPFDMAPRKLIHRTYICANPSLSCGQFKDTAVAQLSTWNVVKTKSPVQGRQVEFNHKNYLYLHNLCFEFNTNSVDSTGLVFFDGHTEITNLTIALLGTGIYTYGAMILDSEPVHVHVTGWNLADPIVFNPTNWGQWNQNGYTFVDPNYFPGYGIAIVGNPNSSSPTLVNFGPNTAYTGLINVTNGAFLDRIDYGSYREIGRRSVLPSSLILDGKFNANALLQLGNKSRIQSQEYIFKTVNFGLSSKNLKANNQLINFVNPTYTLEVYDDPKSKVNFKYINYAGSFSTLYVVQNGFTNWTFSLNQQANTQYVNTFLNVFNGNVNDNYYIFYPNASINYIDLSNVLGTVGYLNYLTPSYNPQAAYNNNTTMQYVGVASIPFFNGNNAYRLNSPLDNLGTNNVYDLNFYEPSTR